MKTIRRNDRAISTEAAMSILTTAEYGVLSTVSAGGNPYGVPLNFCVVDGCIYFHCAIEGRKLDHIGQNPSVSFCVVGKTEILPLKFSTLYESVIVFGRAEEVFEAEKQKGLEGLIKKYAADFVEEGKRYIEKLWTETKVYKITIDHLSGKARRK
jgi:nitroimidazol reductase NimA-like FMN-containing flavoprotein (pyridoxamine 5'-phosphate oxidase superfamily)